MVDYNSHPVVEVFGGVDYNLHPVVGVFGGVDYNLHPVVGVFVETDYNIRPVVQVVAGVVDYTVHRVDPVYYFGCPLNTLPCFSA